MASHGVAERMARKVCRTHDDVMADVIADIERFCNPARRHSTLAHVRTTALRIPMPLRAFTPSGAVGNTEG